MNPARRRISKKRRDQPYHQEEFSSKPCNQEAPFVSLILSGLHLPSLFAR
jgi:hypothetical protein